MKSSTPLRRLKMQYHRRPEVFINCERRSCIFPSLSMSQNPESGTSTMIQVELYAFRYNCSEFFYFFLAFVEVLNEWFSSATCMWHDCTTTNRKSPRNPGAPGNKSFLWRQLGINMIGQGSVSGSTTSRLAKNKNKHTLYLSACQSINYLNYLGTTNAL